MWPTLLSKHLPMPKDPKLTISKTNVNFIVIIKLIFYLFCSYTPQQTLHINLFAFTKQIKQLSMYHSSHHTKHTSIFKSINTKNKMIATLQVKYGDPYFSPQIPVEQLFPITFPNG